MTSRFALPTAATAILSLALAACSEGPATPEAEKRQEVGVLTLQPAPRPFVRELPGRIAPTRIAEVRARVSGIVMERNFEQGSDVKAGDVLYRLDRQAVRGRACTPPKPRSPRLRPCSNQETQNSQACEALWPTRAISQSQLETGDREPAARRRPTSPRARPTSHARSSISIDTVIRAPISGRIGRAHGDRRRAGRPERDLTHVATVQQLSIDLCRLHPVGRAS